ncbi:hypothetical protein [Microcoleus sp. CAWBG556]|uniref:hypothetical protein n=1 Tax=Microcoleus sp. CAWBG556 TaxID=2841650 RepID=UPI0025D3D9B7|nr:hypothetical protein [Microcoleus sp. CAWBG556]
MELTHHKAIPVASSTTFAIGLITRKNWLKAGAPIALEKLKSDDSLPQSSDL